MFNKLSHKLCLRNIRYRYNELAVILHVWVCLLPFQQSVRNENEALQREVAQLKEQLRREKQASTELAKEKVRILAKHCTDAMFIPFDIA